MLPKSFYQRVDNIAHEAYQELSRTKTLLREEVWFPGIDTIAQKTLESCLACHVVSQSAPPEPLQPSQLPAHPWHTIHVGFLGPLPSSKYLQVVIDRYSR